MSYTSNNINFLIVDDHPLICAALSHILEKKSYTKSIQHAHSSIDAMKIIRDETIDFIILDIDLINSDGFELLRRARSYGYNGYVLFISSHDNKLYSETAFQLGASGYITKNEGLTVITDSVESILKGYILFKPVDTNQNKESKLSNREVVVFSYLIKGHSNKDIASMLSLSSKTISTYKARIFEKYKVKSVVDLMKVKELVAERAEKAEKAEKTANS